MESFTDFKIISALFSDKYRVVGFEVEPMSVSVSDIKFEGDTCNFPDTPKLQVVSLTHISNIYFSLNS